MHSAIALLFFLFIASPLAGVSNAQNVSPEIVEAGKRVDEAFDQNLKGWTREYAVPMALRTRIGVQAAFWRRYP